MTDHDDLADLHIRFAKQANGAVWRYLESAARTPTQDDEMLYAACASAYHWGQVGAAIHRQRAEYLIAKVYLARGDVGLALRHAQTCFALTAAHSDEMADFDRAFAHEMLARTLAANHRLEDARPHYTQAQTLGAAIADEEDRTIFEQDLTSGAWFGLAGGE